MSNNFDASSDFQSPAPTLQDGHMIDEKVELLSAYLDGEVTVQERQQVQAWLDHDPEIRHLHQRMLRLRQCLRDIPIPEPSRSSEQQVKQVFARLDRRQQWRRLALAGGGAIAAMFVGMFLNPLSQQPASQSDLVVQPVETQSAQLMIAVNQPVIEIPRAILPDARTVEQ